MTRSSGDSSISVVLERGRKRVIAAALDWPGWCRVAHTEQESLDALADYAGRYAAALSTVPEGQQLIAAAPLGRLVDGHLPPTTSFAVVETLAGTATTDFGAPDARAAADEEPVDPSAAARLALILEAAWACFDEVVAVSPEQLRKGPRGGGRDTSQIVDHVREAERSYARQWAAKVPPRTPWPEQRQAIVAALRSGRVLDEANARWPVRYSVRRTVWHVLDHAWEIEDRR